jgi:hypothetical protein
VGPSWHGNQTVGGGGAESEAKADNPTARKLPTNRLRQEEEAETGAEKIRTGTSQVEKTMPRGETSAANWRGGRSYCAHMAETNHTTGVQQEEQYL